MIRMLPRVYLLTAFLLVMGLALPWVAVRLNLEHNNEVMKKVFRGQMRLAAERLREAEDMEAELEVIQGRFDFPIEVVDWPADELPRYTWAWLIPSQVFVWDVDDVGLVGYYAVRWGKALRFGPLPRFRFMGWPGYTLLVALFLIGGFLMSRVIVRPLVRQSRVIIRASNEMADGNLAVQVSRKRVPNLPELGVSFNKMAGRIRTILLSQRQLLQDVSHEIRTPLARARFGLEMLRDQTEQQPAGEQLMDQIDETIDQLDRLLGELLEYSRLADQDRLLGRNETLDPAAILRACRDRVSLEQERGLVVEMEVPGGGLPQIRGNGRELARAVDNLVANALRFAKGKVILRAEVFEGAVELSVEDDGPGIPLEQRERVLEPFVQVERQSGHTGLGLAIVQRIVHGHGGELLLDDSRQLGGAWMRIRLPLDPDV